MTAIEWVKRARAIARVAEPNKEGQKAIEYHLNQAIAELAKQPDLEKENEWRKERMKEYVSELRAKKDGSVTDYAGWAAHSYKETQKLIRKNEHLQIKLTDLEAANKSLRAEMDKWNMSTAAIEKDLTFEEENKQLKKEYDKLYLVWEKDLERIVAFQKALEKSLDWMEWIKVRERCTCEPNCRCVKCVVIDDIILVEQALKE